MTEALTRSFWHWGWNEKFPSEDGRTQLAMLAAHLLGGSPPSLLPLPQIESVRCRASRVELPAALQSFCTTDRETRIRHTYGRNFHDLVRGFEGDFSAAPDAVAVPHNEQQILEAMQWCAREGVALVPYGGGTSVVYGVENQGKSSQRTLSLSLARFDRVLEVEPISRSARIQAGAMGPSIETQLARHRMTLRHFPQSFEFSTLGGWLATRAGGHFATLYTHIDDRVQSMRMVTPAGLWQTPRLPGNGAGPEPDRLLLGSEGILGVITEAWMRVLPRPRWRLSASARFEHFEQAVDAARTVAQAGIYPTNCRVLDGTEARLNQVDGEGRSVLVLGFEGHEAGPTMLLELALELCKRNGALECSPIAVREETDGNRDEGARAWREAFVHAPYLQSALVSLGMLADTFETACTWDAFPKLHATVSKAMSAALAEECGGGLLSCRFTHVYPDGPAPYYTFLGRSRSGAQIPAWNRLKKIAGDALASVGATITHHHAVGRLHRPWYEKQVPSVFLQALRASKQALDPSGVMNPGVLLAVNEAGE